MFAVKESSGIFVSHDLFDTDDDAILFFNSS